MSKPITILSPCCWHAAMAISFPVKCQKPEAFLPSGLWYIPDKPEFIEAAFLILRKHLPFLALTIYPYTEGITVFIIFSWNATMTHSLFIKL
jgi:hypothetical protein